MTSLPPIEAFTSTLNNSCISPEDYAKLQVSWVDNKCQTLRDFLEFYNNLDTKPFVLAVDELRGMWRENDKIDLFDAMSIPKLAERVLMKTRIQPTFFMLPQKPRQPYRSVKRQNRKRKNKAEEEELCERERAEVEAGEGA